MKQKTVATTARIPTTITAIPQSGIREPAAEEEGGGGGGGIHTTRSIYIYRAMYKRLLLVLHSTMSDLSFGCVDRFAQDLQF